MPQTHEDLDMRAELFLEAFAPGTSIVTVTPHFTDNNTIT